MRKYINIILIILVIILAKMVLLRWLLRIFDIA